jgi:hypothetical protein
LFVSHVFAPLNLIRHHLKASTRFHAQRGIDAVSSPRFRSLLRRLPQLGQVSPTGSLRAFGLQQPGYMILVVASAL